VAWRVTGRTVEKRRSRGGKVGAQVPCATARMRAQRAANVDGPCAVESSRPQKRACQRKKRVNAVVRLSTSQHAHVFVPEAYPARVGPAYRPVFSEIPGI